jgi:ureidoacrylate peracid hydrolase
MGLYDDLYSVVADRSVLVDGSSGAEIYKDLAPAPGEHVIKKTAIARSSRPTLI